MLRRKRKKECQRLHKHPSINLIVTKLHVTVIPLDPVHFQVGSTNLSSTKNINCHIKNAILKLNSQVINVPLISQIQTFIRKDRRILTVPC